jgi:hypothetical protein
MILLFSGWEFLKNSKLQTKSFTLPIFETLIEIYAI